MRLYSWNVNGLRANLKRGTFMDFINSEQPDILCLQETKTKPDQIEIDLPNYLELWHSADRPGYSGTAIFTKYQPLGSFNDLPPDITNLYPWDEDKFGNPLHEGRLQTVEFEPFYLINMYTPNSKRGLDRLQLREQLWDPAILHYINTLQKVKPVIICGDFNVAHTPLDLARPKDNIRNAGFTDEERQGMKNYLSTGKLVDSFRYFYPNQQKYTWWSVWSHARERNIGWRIDYFLLSESLLPHLENALIHDHIMGSDHCPISIELEF